MKTNTTITLACCAVLGLPRLAPSQELERGWIAVRQDLELFLEPAANRLHLEGTLVARLEHDEASTGLVLALNARDPLMSFERVSADGADVALNGSHAETGEALIARMSFADPKRRGDEVEIRFACDSKGRGRQFLVEDAIAFASWVEAWYPVLLAQEGVSLGGATQVSGRTTFYMPAGWRAVTNGKLLTSESRGERAVEVWETERALSRSFAAGPYEVVQERVGELDVSLYLLSDDLPDPRAHVESLSAAIEAMEERWGPYPYPSYAIAEIPEGRGGFGASSEQGFIMVKPNYLELPEGNLPLFAHEASHGWWGNTVGAEGPGRLLCTESLAQYGAVIAAEHLWGKAGATEFLRFSRPGYVANQCARGYFGLWRDGLDEPLAGLVSGEHPDHTLADAKGHWVFHMLRRRVGDEVFFGTLRGLIRDYSGRTMTLSDVRAAFVEAAPEAGLVEFFAQWLDRTGAPVLRHAWQAQGDELVLDVEQLQDGGSFTLSLDVEIGSESGPRRVERVVLTEREQRFRIAGADGVTDVRLDPEHELLLWRPEYGAAPVPGLEDVEPEALAPERIAVYAGVYVAEDVGVDVVIASADGQLTVAVADRAPQRLVHTGGERFRSADGFLVFEVPEDRARSLLFVRDGGGLRRAVRRE